MRIAVLFSRFGPYHIARLEAVGQEVSKGGGELAGIEVASASQTYAWAPVEGGRHFRKITLSDGRAYEALSKREARAALRSALDAFAPDVVVLPGWSASESLEALGWAMDNGVPAVVMSDSARIDAPRRPWTEAIKRRIVRGFSAGFVAGSRHADYLTELDMPRDRIYMGYDVVDNDFFASGAAATRDRAADLRTSYRLPERYFLASSRFIPKKNLSRLLAAFAQYQAEAGSAGWDLVLCGDGPLRQDLECQASQLGIQDRLHFAGFIQYDELPIYYGLASAFIHASTVEQWGLVVNEAAAAGLPLLLSERCGCVPELLLEGENGYAFDPCSEASLAGLMRDIAAAPDRAKEMGRASSRIVSGFSLQRFTADLLRAARHAMDEPRQGNAVDRVLVRLMAMR